MRIEYVWIGLTALCWGGYPLVSRSAGYGSARGALILMLAGLLPIGIMAARSAQAGWPSSAGLIKLLIAGVMMGVGLIAFHALASSSMDASVSIPIVDVAMLMVSAIGAMTLFSEPVTLQRLAGIALMLAGIALIRPA